MEQNPKIYIAGHKGMVGSALVRKLKAEGYSNLVLRSSTELDLKDQAAVSAFFEAEKPEYVFFAAAKVGILKPPTYFRHCYANSTKPKLKCFPKLTLAIMNLVIVSLSNYGARVIPGENFYM